MILEELEKELKLLTNKAEKLEREHSELEEQIYDLEIEKNDIESELDEINHKINIIRQNINDFVNNNTDPFVMDFIKASFFCEQRYETGLSYLKITNNEIIACDGYRAIAVKNNDIPNNLKNTFIKWNVRTSFAEKTERDMRYPNIDIKQIAKNVMENYIYKIRTDSNGFYKVFNIEYTSSNDVNIMILNDYIALNQKYLEIALNTFDKLENFDVYIVNKLREILLINNRISIIILPILLHKNED
ncbi:MULTISPECIES: hypothetical protein [Thermoanaerobacterium]|uniref:Uncharacterized protein n=3 Tax=Thermoanaerobacterium TaxID=28895 RepID=L0INV4_THETR|nr:MULTISPECIES: hypothetical protein [Thermoanaerobacterium]AFK94259.1 hypothetical protein Tsac_2712 [Thermoanaerobacterium saccharolyticum JW/SL-YS485]AGB20434.1 hypothetical protein Thethe_02887 [Thermoanaerobacterium thermosaccharolyticum M0795]ETO39171.1 hypothetical protein V518_0759 [Thermoanaerobacterium aotearoense SCUT27]